MPKQPPLLGVLEGVECLKRIIDEDRGLVEAHRGLGVEARRRGLVEASSTRLGVEVSRILYVNGGWSQGEKRRGCRGCVEATHRG